MKRKIVRHGPSSLTVSLPSKWVQKYNLKSGEEVEVSEEGSSLIVHGQGMKKASEISINIKEPLMKRAFVSPYVKGYDVITYRFNSIKHMAYIEENLDLMYGFEIIHQGESFITIKNIAIIKEDEFDNMMNRMFHICFDMFDLIASFIQKYDQNIIRRIQSLEKTMTKLDLYCRRLLNQEFVYKENKGSVYGIIRMIEIIADHFVTIAIYMKPVKKGQEEIISLITKLREAFQYLEKGYFSKKMRYVYDYKQLEDEIWSQINKEADDSIPIFFKLKIESLYFYLHHLSEELVVISNEI